MEFLDKYEKLSDEELIEISRAGDSGVEDYLCDKYKNLVRSKAKNMYMLGGDSEDLIQEGMIGLFKAVKDYDSGRDASFMTFAELCINRQIYNAIQKSNRKKNLPLNSYISLYTDDDEQNGNFYEGIVDTKKKNPEEIILEKERIESLQRKIEEELSDFEKQVLDLLLIGMSYTEIARILSVTDKSADNCIQRIKSKIKKLRD